MQSPIEKEVIKIIQNHKKELTKTDIKEIIAEVMPDLDQMIAKHVKDHFVAIANYIKDSF